MPDATFADMAQQFANDILVWTGFGTLVGLLAKAIMPGRDPGGAVATLLMGVGGSVIGSGTLMYFSGGQRVTPISPLGFCVATAGAFALLFFARLLAPRWGTTTRSYVPKMHARKKRDALVQMIDE